MAQLSQPSTWYLLSALEPVEEICVNNVEQDDLYVSLPDLESEASEPLSAEMKVNEENVPKPSSNNELIKNSDPAPTESLNQWMNLQKRKY